MSPTYVLRHARPGEARAARTLAALDSALPLRGEVLLAFSGLRAVAAISMLDGRVVADPFVPTLEAVELLREHADGVRAGRGLRRRDARLRHLRLGQLLGG